MYDVSKIVDPETESMEDFIDRKRAFEAAGGTEDDDDDTSPFGDDDVWLAHRDVLMQLPAVERSIVELCRQGETFYAIAERLHLTWQGVTWRVARLRRRIELLSKLPNWSTSDVRSRLLDAGVSPEDADIVATWWETSSQSLAARRLGLPRLVVRRRILETNKCLVDLARVEPRHQPLSEAVSFFLRECANIRDGWLQPPTKAA